MAQPDPQQVLFISYDGLTDALGQSQILAYLERLTGPQRQISILSFEKPEQYPIHEPVVRDRVNKAGIRWIECTYTKSPPVLSTLKDIRQGRKAIARYLQDTQPDIIHCRGYIPCMLGLYAARKSGAKVIFDMRGWWADEKVESGSWASPVFRPIYKYFKSKEREFFRRADHSVSLTHSGADYIKAQGWAPAEKVSVIPTCVNFDYFPPFDAAVRDRFRQKLGIPSDAKVLVYSGSIGGNYPFAQLLALYENFRQQYPGSRLLILSKTDTSIIERSTGGKPLRMEETIITSVAYKEIAQYLMAADAGVIMYTPGFSTIGRSPTKLGEYWSSGLPVIALGEAGDLKALSKRYPGGITLLPFGESQAPDWNTLLQADKSTLHAHAVDYFSLDRGINFYDALYRGLED